MKTLKTEIYQYKIPSFYLSLIFNGDMSGLNDDDIKAWDKFEKNINDEFKNYTWDIPKDDFETHFCKYNDVLGYIGCDCIDMNLVEFINQ